MKKYFIYYNNGQFESVDSMNITLMHMVEVAVIKIIFDCEGDKCLIRLDDGTSKWVTCTKVSGLI